MQVDAVKIWLQIWLQDFSFLHFFTPFCMLFCPGFCKKKEPKLALFLKVNVNIVKSYLRYNLTLRVLFKVYISSLISVNRRI